MKIEPNTPQDRLKKSAKRCRVWFWICLVIGISGLVSAAPAGLIFLAVAAWLWLRKKKALGILQQQDEATVFKYQPKVETKHQEIKAQQARIASIETNASTESAAKDQAEAEARQAAIHEQMEAWRNSQKELSARICQDYVSVGRTSTHVVGTSFLNDDGSSRRNNLAFCYVGKKLEIRPFTYQGDPAYAVFTDDGQIGNLPATTAQEISEYGDDLIVTGEISQMLTDEYDDAYSCRVNLTVYRHK